MEGITNQDIINKIDALVKNRTALIYKIDCSHSQDEIKSIEYLVDRISVIKKWHEKYGVVEVYNCRIKPFQCANGNDAEEIFKHIEQRYKEQEKDKTDRIYKILSNYLHS